MVFVLSALSFFLVKLVVSLCFLGVAGVSDLRFRLVSNRVWAVFAPICVVLCVVECVLFGSAGGWLLLVGSWLLVVGGSFVVWRCGGFGGADCKCLMCLGLIFPFFPLTSLPLFGLFVLFFACVWGFGDNSLRMFLYNIVDKLRGGSWFAGLEDMPLLKKLVLLFCATRVRVERLGSLFWSPCENGAGGFFVFGVRHDVAGAVERLRNVVGAKSYVWAVRSLPLVWYMFLSLLVVSVVWLMLLSSFGVL